VPFVQKIRLVAAQVWEKGRESRTACVGSANTGRGSLKQNGRAKGGKKERGEGWMNKTRSVILSRALKNS